MPCNEVSMPNEPTLDVAFEEDILELTDIVSATPKKKTDFDDELESLLNDIGVDPDAVKQKFGPAEAPGASKNADAQRPVDPDEELELPELSDLDSLLEQLGAGPIKNSSDTPEAKNSMLADDFDAHPSRETAPASSSRPENTEKTSPEEARQDVYDPDALAGEGLDDLLASLLQDGDTAKSENKNPAQDLMADLGLAAEPAGQDAPPPSPEDDLLAELGIAAKPTVAGPAGQDAPPPSPEDDLLAELGIAAKPPVAEPAGQDAPAPSPEDDLLAELGFAAKPPVAEPAGQDAPPPSPEDDLLAELGIAAKPQGTPPPPLVRKPEESSVLDALENPAFERMEERAEEVKALGMPEADGRNAKESLSPEEDIDDGGIDLNELDSLLDNVLAGAPAPGPLPGEALSLESSVTALAGASGLAEMDARISAISERLDGMAPVGEVFALKRDLEDLKAGAANATGTDAGALNQQAEMLEKLETASEAQALDLFELKRQMAELADEKDGLKAELQASRAENAALAEELAALKIQAAEKVAVESLAAPPEQTGEVEALRERCTDLEARLDLQYGNIEALKLDLADLNANMEKHAAAAAAKVLREEIAALMQAFA